MSEDNHEHIPADPEDRAAFEARISARLREIRAEVDATLARIRDERESEAYPGRIVMDDEIAREYMALIEETAAYFAAQVEWSESGRIVTDQPQSAVEAFFRAPRVQPFAERFLLELERIRYRQFAAHVRERAMRAGV